MKPSVNNVFDQHYMMVKGKFKYPYVCIENPTEELPVIIDLVKSGELPLVVFYEGSLVEVATVEKSPMAISKLLRLYKLVIVTSPETRVEINTVEELLEMSDFSWMR